MNTCRKEVLTCMNCLVFSANKSNPTAMSRIKDTGHSAQISIQAVAESSQHRKQSASFHSHRYHWKKEKKIKTESISMPFKSSMCPPQPSPVRDPEIQRSFHKRTLSLARL